MAQSVARPGSLRVDRLLFFKRESLPCLLCGRKETRSMILIPQIPDGKYSCPPIERAAATKPVSHEDTGFCSARSVPFSSRRIGHPHRKRESLSSHRLRETPRKI